MTRTRAPRRDVSRRAVWLVAVLASCGPADGYLEDAPPGPAVGPVAEARVAESLETCGQCHRATVASYLGHGMAYSVGPLDEAPSGGLTNTVSGDRYEFEQEGDALHMRAVRPDGGERTQVVVGRIGAGVIDTTFVGSELGREGAPTGRLSFLPLESIRGHGLALSPFEVMTPGTGFGMPVADECLRCHTTDTAASLPGAARDGGSDHVWPGELLGADAFAHLQPLGCDACHGPVERHAELRLEALDSGKPPASVGLERLGDLPPGRQRDVCARCHLQGEGHMALAEIAPGGPQPADFLARRPVLVPANPGDDFRFVGQVQRLVLSECFQGSPDMTCTTCHEPHASVVAQGTASFDARCLTCHETADACSRQAALTVEQVTGDPPRTESGCVDCHVRRSQPFDLPHTRTADHFVRREIPRPSTAAMRTWEDPRGELTVFDDGRFADVFATPAGSRWVDVLVALRLGGMGRVEEALAKLATLPPPGSEDARRAEDAAGLPPVRSLAVVHHLRALLLESAGDAAGARAAYGDALALDPAHPQARLNRASLALQAGDMATALEDATFLQARYPQAEKPWNLRALAAARAGNVSAQAAALVESTWAWPADAATWHALGRAFLAMRRPDDARLALRQAARLQPSRPGLAEDLAVVGL